MRIVVCLGRAVDPDESLELRSGVERLDAEKLVYWLNAADACALEQALRLKERRPHSEVFVLSMTPPRGSPVLRNALSLGADAAIRLWDARFEGSDSLATARILAAAIRRLGTDLILCGDRATDGNTGQVALQLAELLGWPAIPGALDLDALDDGELRAQRKLDRGLRCTVRCSLPALFTVEPGTSRPRYPRLRDRLRAEAASIPTWGLDDLGLKAQEVGERGSRTRVVGVSRPKPSTKGMFIPDADLSPEERWEQIVSGGGVPGQAQSGPAGGSPQDQVAQIVGFLERGGYL
ncbi:MAG: electron transfer flavoprotein subunit beta/FixA family protein [Myxococcota bacterium]